MSAAVGMALAAILGGLAALASIAFFEGAGIVQHALNIAADGKTQYWWALAISPAIAGLICALIKNRMNVGFCGLSDTMLAAQRDQTQSWRTAAASIVASFVAFGGGASVGQYGPVGHLGGFIGGWFRRWWSRGVGPACGVAAAIAAAFNAPVTGLLFAHEVILRHYSARAFAPVAVAAVVGYTVSVGVFERPPFLSIGDMQTVALSDFLIFGMQGAIFGTLSALYLRAIFVLGQRLSPLPKIPLFVTAGAICGLLWVLSPEAIGGRELLRLAVEDGSGDWRAIFTIGVIKAAATILCLGAGFAGGVVSPTLVVGAFAGALYAMAAAAAGVYDGPPFVPVVCGMIAFTAPAIGAPLAGILFVLELSGGNYPLTVAASLAVALSMLSAGKLGGGSYYERQLRARGIDIKTAREQWDLATTTVGELLSPAQNILHIDIDAPFAAAKKRMLAAGESFIWAVEKDGRYAGRIDLSRAIGGNHLSVGDGLSVVPCLQKSDTLAAALDCCTAGKTTWIPIVDSDGKLVGALNDADLLRARDNIRRKREQETE